MSTLFRTTLIVLCVLAFPVLAMSLGGVFLLSPVAGGLGLLFAAIYSVLIIVVLRFMPIWPRGLGRGGVVWWLVSCLVWGAGVSSLAAILTAVPVMELAALAGWEDALFSFGGAYPEEIGKALGVAVILMSFRALNRPWHGLATGAIVGLGFEVNENILYGASFGVLDPEADWIGVLAIWGLRMVTGPLLHVLWTGLAGWGLGLALFTAGRTVAWRFGVGLVWLLIPFVLHFAWNYMWGSATVQTIAIIVIALIFYPLSIWVFVRAIRLAGADDSYSHTPRPITSVRQLPPAVMTLALETPEPEAVGGPGEGAGRADRRTDT